MYIHYITTTTVCYCFSSTKLNRLLYLPLFVRSLINFILNVNTSIHGVWNIIYMECLNPVITKMVGNSKKVIPGKDKDIKNGSVPKPAESDPGPRHQTRPLFYTRSLSTLQVWFHEVKRYVPCQFVAFRYRNLEIFWLKLCLPFVL